MPNDRAFSTRLFAGATRRLPEIYVLVALFVCGALGVITPPLWIPDEASHLQREMGIGRGEWMAQRTPEGVGAQIDVNFLGLVRGLAALHDRVEAEIERTHLRPDHLVTEAELVPLRTMRWARETRFSSFQSTAVYPPALYLPAALALRVGAAAGLRIARTMVLSRLAAALCAIALGWVALRLSGGWRWLLFGYLLIPTVLNLNASCSQDALLLNAAALAMVLTARALTAGRELSLPELTGAGVLLAACIGGRSPYLFLAAALLLPALELPGPVVWRGVAAPVAAIAAIVAVVGAWQWSVRGFGLFTFPDAQPAAQAALLRAHPARGLEYLAEGTARVLPMILVKGPAWLGANDVFPPHLLYGLLLLALAGLCWFAPWHGLTRGRSRLLLGVALLGIAGGISVAEYLIWTPVGVAQVDGLQARYYLPLLPFAFLLLPAVRREGHVREVGTLCAATVLVCVVIAMPWVAANRFYHSGLGPAVAAALR